MRAGSYPEGRKPAGVPGEAIEPVWRSHAPTREMSKGEWGEWVDALPIPEFMAMCCMTPDQAAAALRARASIKGDE